MKRRFKVSSHYITIDVTINNKDHQLMRDEVDQIRDELADEIQNIVAGVRWLGVYRHTVKVR